MPDDVLAHIRQYMQTPLPERSFGRLQLGLGRDRRLTRARRDWLRGEGIDYKELTGDLDELKRIGLLTRREAQLRKTRRES